MGDLQPTIRKKDEKKFFRIILILILTALAIAGIAHLSGNLLYRQDYNRLTEQTPQPLDVQPAENLPSKK